MQIQNSFFAPPVVRRNNGKVFRISAYGKAEYEMMVYLVEKTKKAGHQLTFEEALMDPDMIYPNEFPRCTSFCSFAEAAKAAWAEANLSEPVCENEPCLIRAGENLADLWGL